MPGASLPIVTTASFAAKAGSLKIIKIITVIREFFASVISIGVAQFPNKINFPGNVEDAS